MAELEPQWTDEQLQGDGVSKKDICTFIQANAAIQFQKDHKLKGALKNVVKTTPKDKLIAAYKELFETKAFKKEGEDEEEAAAAAAAKEIKDMTEKTDKLTVKEEEGPAQYTKRLVKKGDKVNYPKKGDMVSCFYKGTLDGKVFDTNMNKKGKKAPVPLRFKVGVGNVIKGWDVGIMTMSTGEKAELVIEPAWAYGKKGLEGKIPPNSRLTFEVELICIE